MYCKIAIFCLTLVSVSTFCPGSSFAQTKTGPLVTTPLKNTTPLKKEPLVAKYLESGEISEGITALTKHLRQHPQDQNERFGLGILYLMNGVEEFAQFQYRHGLMSQKSLLTQSIPFLRLPVEPNKNPEEISYQQAGNALQSFLTNLKMAEMTLSQVDTSEVKLPIRFGKIRLDLNDDGKASDDELFWKIYAGVSRNRIDATIAEKFVIAFDGGDVYWLRGYCHLLMGMGDVVLAHDCQELFERCAHLAYPKVKTKYKFLLRANDRGGFEREILDSIAAIHLINLEVTDAKRMESALAHFEAMAELSHKSWDLIQKENDDDREWLPNPKQKGVLGVQVTQRMIDTWLDTMTEFDLILKGKKLIPFWRGAVVQRDNPPGRNQSKTANDSAQKGINLRRVFTEPRKFDLVLWVQGTAAVPYLEEGKVTDPRIWRSLQRIFGGEIFGFAAWFN